MRVGPLRTTQYLAAELSAHFWRQQDAFLPHVESGLITLVGATTENPSFALNRALLSRCRVHCLERLGHEDVCRLLRAALEDPERGLAVSALPPLSGCVRALWELTGSSIQGNFVGWVDAGDGDAGAGAVKVEVGVVEAIAQLADGDARCPSRHVAISDHGVSLCSMQACPAPRQRPHHFSCSAARRSALNALEAAVGHAASRAAIRGGGQHRDEADAGKVVGSPDTPPVRRGSPREVVVEMDDVRRAVSRPSLQYDKTGDEHHNAISAFHKSIRGGDPQVRIPRLLFCFA